jgi:prepilin-type N-terminal cleavage/methylation domain-containing protein
MTYRRAGFTLIELMITIAIVAILSMVAAPSMRDLMKNARMTSLVNDLMGDLNVARAEAVKRGVPASICTSNNGTSCTATEWRFGWIVFAEADTAGALGTVDAKDAILKISPKINGADEPVPTLVTSKDNPTSGGVNFVTYRPSGVTKAGGGATMHFYMCDSRKTGSVSASEALNKGRHITLLGTGRAQSNRCTCTNTGLQCDP